jgi:hypothetical protein
MKRRIFDTPFDLFKEKSFHFHLLEGKMNLFGNLKRSKIEETAQYFEKQFFLKQILYFHCPSKMFMPHNEIMKYCQNHWSLIGMVCVLWVPVTY